MRWGMAWAWDGVFLSCTALGWDVLASFSPHWRQAPCIAYVSGSINWLRRVIDCVHTRSLARPRPFLLPCSPALQAASKGQWRII